MAEKKGGGKKSWFATGAEGAKKAKEADEESKKKRELKGNFPFHLKNDEEAKGTFLDTPSFFFKQHTIKLPGNKYLTETCIADFDECPLCGVKDAAYVVAGTVIDHREFEGTQDGKKVTRKNVKRPIIFKSKARENILREIKDEKGDLSRCVYRLSRGSNTNECATGESFKKLGRFADKDMKKMVPAGADPKEWLKPYGLKEEDRMAYYAEMFKPKSPAELQKLLGAAPPIGAEKEESETASPSGAAEPDAKEDYGESDIRNLI